MSTEPTSTEAAATSDGAEIRPFEIDVSDEELADLRNRVDATRWPDRETDASQGVQLETIQALAESGFSEQGGAPAWKDLPSWAVVATGDKAAGTDVIRSMAERAGATITEVDGSHVIMVSQPQAVTDVILEAVAAVG